MALNGLLDIDLAVKNPQELCEFWERRGLNSPTAGVLGTDDRKKQITIIEDDYRHLDALHLSCEFESDLVAIAQRIGEMGVESKISGTNLSCVDPVFGHRISIDVGAAPSLQQNP